jgi:hypothetical protein
MKKMKRISKILVAALFLFAYSSDSFAANGEEIKVVKSNVSEQLKTASASGINTILVITDSKADDLDAAIQLAEETAALREKVMIAVIDRDLDENKSLVQSYNLSRYPLPFLLIASPSGSVTGGSAPGKITAEKLAFYIPSPCHNLALSARLDGKGTLILITDSKAKKDKSWGKVLKEVQKNLTPEPVVIDVDINDENERTFLTRIGYKREELPMLMVVNTAGQVTDKYNKLPEADEVKASLDKVVKKGCGSSCPSSKSCTDKKKSDCGSN